MKKFIFVVILIFVSFVAGILVDRRIILAEPLEPYHVQVRYVDRFTGSFTASDGIYDDGYDDDGEYYIDDDHLVVNFPNLTTQSVSIDGVSMRINEKLNSIQIDLYKHKDEEELSKEYQKFVEKTVKEKERKKEYYRQQLRDLGDDTYDPKHANVVH